MSKENFGNQNEFRDWFRIVMRVWSEYLSPAELSICFFVLDRTMGWNKEWEIITLEHFTEGVCNNCKRYSGLLQISPSTVKRALSSLKTRKFLLHKRKFNTSLYSLNYEWTPEETMSIPEELQDMLKRSKKDTPEDRGSVLKTSKKSPNSGLLLGHPDLPVGQIDPLRITILEEEQNEKRTILIESDDSMTRIGGVMDEIRRKSGDRIAKMKEKRKMQQLQKISHLECASYFVIAAREAGFKVPSFLTKEAHAIKKTLSRKTKTRGEFEQLVDWVVVNWLGLMESRFAWMTFKPAEPSILFFVKHVDQFLEGYADKAKVEEFMNMSPTERKIQKLIQKGHSRDAAEAEVNRRSRGSDEMQQLQKEKQELLNLRRSLSVSQQRQQQMDATAARARQIEDDEEEMPLKSKKTNFSKPINLGKWES